MRRMIAAGPPAKRPPHSSVLDAAPAVGPWSGRRLARLRLLVAAAAGRALAAVAGRRQEPSHQARRVYPGSAAAASAGRSPSPTAEGKPVELGDFKGKPVVVNLWATWCRPASRRCRRSIGCRPSFGGKLGRCGGLARTAAAPSVVGPFVAEHGPSANSRSTSTRKAAAAHAFEARGLPTSILDRRRTAGCSGGSRAPPTGIPRR